MILHIDVRSAGAHVGLRRSGTGRRRERTDAIFMGAIGLSEASCENGSDVAGAITFWPRFGMSTWAATRPVRNLPGVPKLRRIDRKDIVAVRENVEALYASRGAGTHVRDELAIDTIVVTRVATERVVRPAFEPAGARAQGGTGPTATTVGGDKANVLASYALLPQGVRRGGCHLSRCRQHVDAMTGTANPTTAILSASTLLEWLVQGHEGRQCRRGPAADRERRGVHRGYAAGTGTLPRRPGYHVESGRRGRGSVAAGRRAS